MTYSLCTACGDVAALEVTAPLPIDHAGKTVTIQDRRMQCGHCGTISYIGSQIAEHELAVAAAVREMDGLLSAEELRRVRAKYRLRQTDMEQMLSIGPKTWTRWERGRIPQSKAADKLIRMIAEDPEVARRLMEMAGVSNSEAAGVFAHIEAGAKLLARAVLEREAQSLRSADDEQFAIQMADKAFETVRDTRRQAAAQAEAA